MHFFEKLYSYGDSWMFRRIRLVYNIDIEFLKKNFVDDLLVR